MRLPSGEQLTLCHLGQRAIVTEVGATLRSYEVDGVPILWGFGAHERSADGRGQVLAPWPNRLEDGRFRFGGTDVDVPLDEPTRRNAIHGLVRWLNWRVDEVSGSACRLSYVLHPQPSYPFTLALGLEYRLDALGLTVAVRAANDGSNPLPFAIGFHPYLAAGPGGLDRCRLSVPASRRLVLDARGLPIGAEAVAGTVFEPISDSAGGDLAPLHLDDCFTGLRAGPSGRWFARLARGDERPSVIELWADAAFGHVMCFTADGLARDERRRGIAIEPMTAPPNALRSGASLLVLAPGDVFQANWGLRVHG